MFNQFSSRTLLGSYSLWSVYSFLGPVLDVNCKTALPLEINYFV